MIEADFELGVATVVDTVDFWLPMFVAPTDTHEAEDRTINVVAKLRSSVAIARAQAEMEAIAHRQAEAGCGVSGGASPRWGGRVVPLREMMTAGTRDGVVLLSRAPPCCC